MKLSYTVEHWEYKSFNCGLCGSYLGNRVAIIKSDSDRRYPMHEECLLNLNNTQINDLITEVGEWYSYYKARHSLEANMQAAKERLGLA